MSDLEVFAIAMAVIGVVVLVFAMWPIIQRLRKGGGQ